MNNTQGTIKILFEVSEGLTKLTAIGMDGVIVSDRDITGTEVEKDFEALLLKAVKLPYDSGRMIKGVPNAINLVAMCDLKPSV